MTDLVELRVGQRQMVRAAARQHSIDEGELMKRVRTKLTSMPGRRYGPFQHATRLQLEQAIRVVLAEQTATPG
jgi:hypothetical protein